MNEQLPHRPRRVLLLGATGRTGSRVLAQLLDRGVPVRAIVRSADRLPAHTRTNPLLDVVAADLLAMPPALLASHLAGCDAAISCLGHTLSVRGVLGPPRDLVEQAVRAVTGAARAGQPIRLVLMSSVSVHRPADTRRGRGERAALWVIRGVLPPARDNQRAADFLASQVGPGDPHVQWVVVRPDSLCDGEPGEYQLSAELVSSLRHPDSTKMAQVAHFMCELVTDDTTWQRWRGRMPVITDASPALTG